MFFHAKLIQSFHFYFDFSYMIMLSQKIFAKRSIHWPLRKYFVGFIYESNMLRTVSCIIVPSPLSDYQISSKIGDRNPIGTVSKLIVYPYFLFQTFDHIRQSKMIGFDRKRQDAGIKFPEKSDKFQKDARQIRQRMF